ncbi:MAG: HD domain-containing protein [Candidatus Walczuchella monophlebidarum]
MEEFNKIMLSRKPSVGLKLLHKSGLLSKILPELTDLEGVEEKEGHYHKDNFFHTLEVVDNISKVSDSLWLRWAALLHDIGKSLTKKYVSPIGWTFHSHEFVGARMIITLFQRLKLPMVSTVKYVKKIVQLSSRPIALVSKEATDSAFRRLLFDAGKDIDDLMLLCKADITTKNYEKRYRYKNNFALVEKKLLKIEEKDRIRNWQSPISGEEIMKIFNLRPSPKVGIIKKSIKEAVLEGHIAPDRESVYSFILKKGKELGL